MSEDKIVSSTGSEGPKIMCEDIQRVWLDIKSEMSRAVIGQVEPIENMMICLLAGGHILLEGVPGVAKNTARTGIEH